VQQYTSFSCIWCLHRTSIKINRLEEGHNSYPLVCRRPAKTVSLQRRQISYRWGTPAYWSLVPRSSMFYLLFYTHIESEFLQNLVKDQKIHEARAFNFTYRYINDVLSINNSRFAEFLPLIYPPELEVKETTDTASFHYMKMHHLLSSLQRRNIFRQDLGIEI
jgi:hypothetical protein